MLTTATLKMYDIEKCGYYERGSTTPRLSNFQETLSHLTSWAKDGRELVNTTCYQADNAKDQFNTYFLDFHEKKEGSDSLLILWNESINDDGVIYGLNQLLKPGQATTMEETSFGDKLIIPGFPSYFWFVPDQNSIVSVKFNHSSMGILNFKNYIKGYLKTQSPYKIKIDDQITGYGEIGVEPKIPLKVKPQFYMKLKKNKNVIEKLHEERKNIKYFIRKEVLGRSKKDQRGLIEKVFSGFLNEPKPQFKENVISEFKLEYSPNKKELDEIINSYTDEDHLDIGFELQNRSRIMLDGTACKFTVNLSIPRKINQIFNPELLLNELIKEKKIIFSQLKS